MPDLLVAELETHQRLFGVSPDGLLFTSPRGALISRSWFNQRRLKPAAAGAGIGDLTAHDLRHSHVAHLIAEGVHPKAIQMRLGHGSIRVTMDTYGHLLDGVDADAAAALNRAWSVDREWTGRLRVVR
jgi:integrase